LSKSTRSKKFARVTQLVRRVKDLPSSIRRGVIEIAVIGVIALVMLAAAFQPFFRGDAEKTSRTETKNAASSLGPSSYTTPGNTLAETAPKASASKPALAPVTITGCLERGNDAFQLKDTSGADAPKSRSWKTGFLKKRPAPVDVVDGANRLKLSNHVGERVSVTGILVDREMQGRSLRVSGSCASDSKTKTKVG